MNTELWTGSESGVLLTPPLLLEACRAEAFGSTIEYPGGKIENALFTYLSGMPDAEFFDAHPELFCGKFLVCMSREWEDFLISSPYVHKEMRRRMMRPMCAPSSKKLRPLPESYEFLLWNESVFASHPFGHGENYADFAVFKARGSGAAVRFHGETVASASGFISFGSDVELDVSTAPVHRGKGLADMCVAAMLQDCAFRGLTVHWDAQNEASEKMALSHGFTTEQDYRVLIIKR